MNYITIHPITGEEAIWHDVLISGSFDDGDFWVYTKDGLNGMHLNGLGFGRFTDDDGNIIQPVRELTDIEKIYSRQSATEDAVLFLMTGGIL